MNQKGLIIFTGAVVGALSIMLVTMGNPANMGYCIACFLRDTAGGLGLHRVNTVQYIRPEILGLVLGAFTASLFARENRAVGGSSSLTRFVIAFFAMIGMLVFLGCPLRMILRLSAGDLNALVGFAGLAAGVGIGLIFINKGFSLGRAVPQNKGNGYIFPVIAIGILAIFLAKPAYIFFSQQGPGSMHAPIALSLVAGVIVGVLAQRSRLCLVGGIRDFVMFRDTHLLLGFMFILLVALVGNLALGSFKPGFENQPIAHSDGLWNFLGLTLAGFGSALLGGCPLRQLISAAEGNTDSAVTVFGLVAGAAFAHNFGLAASPKGVPAAGQVAVLIGFAVVFLVAVLNSKVLFKQGVSSSAGNQRCAGSPMS